jgi:putative FmdB family regulatory protein
LFSTSSTRRATAVPIYEYRCKQCEQKFELMRRLAKRDSVAACPNCGSKRTARLTIQRFAVVTGAAPDAGFGDGESEDFMGGFGDEGHGHDHGPGMDDDWDF